MVTNRLDKYFWSHRRRRDSDRQANPKFSDEVDRVLRRSNSEIIRHSLSKEIPEDPDESGSQSSEEVEVVQEDEEKKDV